MQGVLAKTLKNLEKEEVRDLLRVLAEDVEDDRANRVERLAGAFETVATAIKSLVDAQAAVLTALDALAARELPAPVVNVPAPVVNVPAPIVNVAAQKTAAPIVKVNLSELKTDLAAIQSAVNDLLDRALEQPEPPALLSAPTAVAKIKPRFRILYETPQGTIDGVNADFFLSRDWKKNHMQLFLNGRPVFEGSDQDYTRNGNKITYLTPPKLNWTHYAQIIQIS